MHGKILVIDAIATNRIVLRVKMAASHYEMMHAGSIGEAMGVIAKSVPDLILCADTLPDGDPVRLLARLRKVGLQGKVPVMVIGAPGAMRACLLPGSRISWNARSMMRCCSRARAR